MTLNHHALAQLAGGVLQQGFDRRHRRVGLLNEFISSGGTGCGRGHEGSLVRLKRHQLYECTAPKKSERPGGSSVLSNYSTLSMISSQDCYKINHFALP